MSNIREKFLVLALTIFGLWSLHAVAEENPFGNFEVGGGNANGDTIDLGGGSGLANSIASPIINSYDPNAINYTDGEAADNSRKNAAATAGKSSGTGQAVHAAIGGTMIGIGTPMSMSIEPITKAAGLDLIAKGIIELAQSGADSGVKDQNNAQRDLLTQKANQEGKQATAVSDAIANNPDLSKALSDRGLNPESFGRSVDSGELNSPSSIMQALGGSEFSPEQLDAASKIAESHMGQIFDGAAANDPTLQKLGYDETNGSSFARNASGSGLESNLDKKLGETGREYMPSGNFAANRTAPGEEGNKNGPGALPQTDFKGMLAGMFGADGQIKPGMEQQALDLLGIRKVKKGGRNIFQEAKYQYRGWGKWRRKFQAPKRWAKN